MMVRILLIVLLALTGCTQTIPIVQGDLNNPSKAALTCFKDNLPVALDECASDGQGYRLYFLEAFRSTLGVIDLDDNTVFDLDVFTPGTTGLPVQGQALDMVTSADGTTLLVTSSPNSLIRVSLTDHSQTIIPFEENVGQIINVATGYGSDLYLLALDGNTLYRWPLLPDGSEYAAIEVYQDLPDTFAHMDIANVEGTQVLGVSGDGLRLWAMTVGGSGWQVISLGPECADGLDNDSDGTIDGLDADCSGADGVEYFWQETEITHCNNGVDDDGDGQIDLEDGGCNNLQDHSESGEGTACDDGLDNDNDGAVDDSGACVPDALAFDRDPCTDGIDNNGDGVSDEDDELCLAGGLELPHGAPCNNGLDDNGNGLIDLIGDAVCLDGDSLAESLPACSDGIDNDGDGLIDDQDTACFADADNSESHGITGSYALVYAHPSQNVAYVLRGAQRDVVSVDLSAMALFPGYHSMLPDLPKDMVFVEVDIEATDEVEASTELKAYISTQGGRLLTFDPENHRHTAIDPENEATVVVGRPALAIQGVGKDIRFSLPEDVAHLGSVDVVEDVSYGITVTSTPYATPTESWSMTSGAVLPETARSTGRILISNTTFYDGGARFCSWGVEAGDLLEIQPGQSIACGDLIGEAFRVEILDVTGEILTFDPSTLQSGVRDEAGTWSYTSIDSEVGLSPQCLSGPLNYAVRVPTDVFLVVGSQSGVIHPWTEDVDGCRVKWEHPEGYNARAKVGAFTGEGIQSCPATEQDVQEGQVELNPFENLYFSLSLFPGCENGSEGPVAVPPVEDAVFTFNVSGGDVPNTVLSTSRNSDLLVDPNADRIFHVDDSANAIYIFAPSTNSLSATIF